MWDVKVERISVDGLSKQVFVFDYDCGSLRYSSHRTIYRDEGEVWSDDPSYTKPLSLEAWCGKNNRDPNNLDDWEDYNAYKIQFNPVCQKTSYGKTKMGGISAPIKDLPPCPDGVAEEAKEKFAQNLKVVWKV
jgi:hypothetical protein